MDGKIFDPEILDGSMRKLFFTFLTRRERRKFSAVFLQPRTTYLVHFQISAESSTPKENLESFKET